MGTSSGVELRATEAYNVLVFNCNKSRMHALAVCAMKIPKARLGVPKGIRSLPLYVHMNSL